MQRRSLLIFTFLVFHNSNAFYRHSKSYSTINLFMHPTSSTRKIVNMKANKSTGTKPDFGIDSVRVNKCILTLSRRGADEAVKEGRVTINGKTANCGDRVFKGDKVKLDGKLQAWESIEQAKANIPTKSMDERSFMYVKYWKPRGVTSTSEMSDKENIIKAGRFDLLPQRMFTVGRLDKDSSGLILLTSDGRVNNALLNPATKKEKVYEVKLNKSPSESQIQHMAGGIVITTPIQRDGTTKEMTAPTKPCKISRIGGAEGRRLEFILTEGRNRQIRRMVEAIGLKVDELHRTKFCGIGLKGVTEGNWIELRATEMQIIETALRLTPNTKTAESHDLDED